MVNLFDYLYYKIYVFSGGENRNSITHIAVTGLFFTSNIWTICVLIMGNIPAIIAYGSILVIAIFFIFYFLPKESKILAKYSKESKQSRIIGNTAVVMYVIVSIVAFALVLKSTMPG